MEKQQRFIHQNAKNGGNEGGKENNKKRDGRYPSLFAENHWFYWRIFTSTE
jgi:hypothetical protein